jgi:hypothetical protein
MASSSSESEASGECEPDSEVEGSNQTLAEPQNYDTLKKELEDEDRVSFCHIVFLRKYCSGVFFTDITLYCFHLSCM